MTVYYVSNTMHPQDFTQVFPDRAKMPGQQVQKFNRLLIEGFCLNNVDVHAVSAIPATRINYDKLFFGEKKHRDGKILYHYLPIVNAPVIKNLAHMLGAALCVCAAKKDDVVICDALNASLTLGAALGAKLRGIKCVGIVTDIPFYMLPGEMRKVRYEKMVDSALKACSHYVLLTEQMSAVVNPENKPYLVIEGLCDQNNKEISRKQREEKTLKCIYAGILYEGYGSEMLVQGFVKANIPEAELHLYGRGSYEDKVRAICADHKNVIYHGEVLNSEVVRAELEADLLINPRPTHEEFTKYSFPSKNMEYMASGTAVLTTRLPGMPDEYLPYIYLIEEESPEGVAKALRKVLALSREERDAKGAAAKEFVMDRKSNKTQAKKILDFLQKS